MIESNQNPNEFEQDLAGALRRVDPPHGMLDRILTVAEAERTVAKPVPARSKILMFPRQRSWLGGALAACLVLGVFGGERLHEERQRAAAQQQFDTATQITNRALEQARQQVERAGIPLDQ